jgi:iron complex transport system ATP-binding protein
VTVAVDTPRAPALEIRGVSVEISGAVVVDGVDLAVDAGEWLAIVGPNGAGKTTLLRYLAGLQRGMGQVDIEGSPLASLGRRALARSIALVPQVPVIPPGMTVYDYVLLGRTPHLGLRLTLTPDDERRAVSVLERLGLVELASRAVVDLSGGERQRVVIGRALAQQPRVLLLDEPTSSLDLGHQQEVLELVEELRSEDSMTVVMTMHDLTLAARFVDRLALLDGGRLRASGIPGEVLSTDLLEDVYGARLIVIDHPDGPIVVPARRP